MLGLKHAAPTAIPMFETSPDNNFVLRSLARAGVGPRTNSIMYDFYKRMPFQRFSTLQV